MREKWLGVPLGSWWDLRTCLIIPRLEYVINVTRWWEMKYWGHECPDMDHLLLKYPDQRRSWKGVRRVLVLVDVVYSIWFLSHAKPIIKWRWLLINNNPNYTQQIFSKPYRKFNLYYRGARHKTRGSLRPELLSTEERA